MKAEVANWQSHVLDKIYPLVWPSDKQAFYLALGSRTDGEKELLGIWASENEGSKFWLQVLTELKNRGVDDILLACADGLVGFPDAIETVCPKTQVQLCIVHMLRNSLKYVSWKDSQSLMCGFKAGIPSRDSYRRNADTFSDK